jgi:hypothetical protein
MNELSPDSKEFTIHDDIQGDESPAKELNHYNTFSSKLDIAAGDGAEEWQRSLTTETFEGFAASESTAIRLRAHRPGAISKFKSRKLLTESRNVLTCINENEDKVMSLHQAS